MGKTYLATKDDTDDLSTRIDSLEGGVGGYAQKGFTTNPSSDRAAIVNSDGELVASGYNANEAFVVQGYISMTGNKTITQNGTYYINDSSNQDSNDYTLTIGSDVRYFTIQAYDTGLSTNSRSFTIVFPHGGKVVWSCSLPVTFWYFSTSYWYAKNPLNSIVTSISSTASITMDAGYHIAKGNVVGTGTTTGTLLSTGVSTSSLITTVNTTVPKHTTEIADNETAIRQLENKLITLYPPSYSSNSFVKQTDVPWLTTDTVVESTISTSFSDWEYLVICLGAGIDIGSGDIADYNVWQMDWTKDSSGTVRDFTKIITATAYSSAGSDCSCVFVIPKSEIDGIKRFALRTNEYVGSNGYRHAYKSWIIKGYDMDASQFFATTRPGATESHTSEVFSTDKTRVLVAGWIDNIDSATDEAETSPLNYYTNIPTTYSQIENARYAVYCQGSFNDRGDTRAIKTRNVGTSTSDTQRIMLGHALLQPKI